MKGASNKICSHDRFIAFHDSSPQSPSRLNNGRKGIINVDLDSSPIMKASHINSKSTYNKFLSTILTPEKKILEFNTALRSFESPFLTTKEEKMIINDVHVKRFVRDSPVKILQAPKFEDDFYLNILDWSTENNIAVFLGLKLYMMNTNNSSVQNLLFMEENNRVTSLKWHNQVNSIFDLG